MDEIDDQNIEMRVNVRLHDLDVAVHYRFDLLMMMLLQLQRLPRLLQQSRAIDDAGKLHKRLPMPADLPVSNMGSVVFAVLRERICTE